MAAMDLDKLEVWVGAKEFTLAVYKEVAPHLPADEKWNLTQQLKRAAQSIPADIAEGHGRCHFLDNVRFCHIARRSLTEVQSRMTSRAASIGGKQLNNYIADLKRSKQGKKDFPAGYTVQEESEPYIPDNPDEDSTERP